MRCEVLARKYRQRERFLSFRHFIFTRASARQILFCLKWSERDLLQCNIRSRHHHHHRRPLDDFTIVGVSIQLNRSCIIWWPLEMIIPWFLMDFNLSCGAVFGLKNWQETTGQKKDNSDQSSFEFSFNTQWTFILFAHLPFRFQQLHKMFEMRSLSQKYLLNGFFFVFFVAVDRKQWESEWNPRR